MKYFFSCEKCKTKKEIEIPMADYSKYKDQQICEKCGCKLERVFNPIGEPIYNAKGFYCTGD